MGCTEPIAVALSRQVLGERPDEIKLVVSRNIIKNVKSVIVPHTKGRKGLKTALCAGICFLYGGSYSDIAHTIVNILAINSGMICDGAKASCAAKIASAVEAGLLGMQMNKHDSQFYNCDGIVVKGVENNIKAVCELARNGMRETDNEIIDLMTKKNK
jgi:L-cysteine desulfidase